VLISPGSIPPAASMAAVGDLEPTREPELLRWPGSKLLLQQASSSILAVGVIDQSRLDRAALLAPQQAPEHGGGGGGGDGWSGRDCTTSGGEPGVERGNRRA